LLQTQGFYAKMLIELVEWPHQYWWGKSEHHRAKAVGNSHWRRLQG